MSIRKVIPKPIKKYLKSKMLMLVPYDIRTHYQTENASLRRKLRMSEQTNRTKDFHLSAISKLHDDVVERAWNNDTEINKWICMKPFERIRIQEDGEVFSCCSVQAKWGHSYGNVFTHSYEEIWNSDNAKKMRYCVSKGSFEYCYDYCPNKLKIGQNFFPREQSPYKFERWQDCHIDTSPKIVNLAVDKSCNLSCVICRNNVKIASRDESERILDMLINVVRPMLKNCEIIDFSTGEFFVSYANQEFVKTLCSKEFPLLKLKIFTNALLLTPSKWDEFETVHDMMSTIAVSIDAATNETYEAVRRGGSFDKLCCNMEFISSLRREGKIDLLDLSFVVQERNFKEMEMFFEMGKKWNVDSIRYKRLISHGVYTHDSFSQSDVFNPNHPNYDEAKRMLQNVKKNSGSLRIYENCLSVAELED